MTFYLDKHTAYTLDMICKYAKGKLLDVGCGRMQYKDHILKKSVNAVEYLGIDIKNDKYQTEMLPDLYYDGNFLPFESKSIDSIMCLSVLEHIAQPKTLMSEMKRVLKDDGLIFIVVPVIWPNHDSPFDFYRYTSWGLNYILKEVGFSGVYMSAFFGWHHSLNIMLNLWKERSPKPKEYALHEVNQLIKQIENIHEQSINPFSNQVIYSHLNVIVSKFKLNHDLLRNERFFSTDFKNEILDHNHYQKYSIVPDVLRNSINDCLAILLASFSLFSTQREHSYYENVKIIKEFNIELEFFWFDFIKKSYTNSNLTPVFFLNNIIDQTYEAISKIDGLIILIVIELIKGMDCKDLFEECLFKLEKKLVITMTNL